MENNLSFSSPSTSWPLTEKVKVEAEVEEEAVIRGLTSDRLFFDGSSTRSLRVEAKVGGGNSGEAAPAFDGGIAVAIETTDPLGDFLVSMEEMVEAHGSVSDWAWLQEMLGWFLRANGKGNHGYIISAFLDLVVGLLCSSSSFSSPSRSFHPCSSSCSSSSSSSCCCCEMEDSMGEELGKEKR